MAMEEKYSSCIILHHDLPSDEEDETLSLCDLPIYSKNNMTTEEDHNLPLSSDEHEQIDHFEFFNEEWSSPVSSPTNNNILFCGKLIANKDYKQGRDGCRSVLQRDKKSKPYDQKRKCTNKYNASSLSTSDCINKIPKSEDKNEMLAYRITIFKSPTRSRWFLFLFGSAKIPTEMEIKEIRRRQIKKSMSHGGSSTKKTSSKNRGIGWWKLIRALGCYNKHHADAVIKASYNCAPLIRE